MSPLRFMGSAKNNSENRKITERKLLDTRQERGVTRILFYSIFAVVPFLITGIRIKGNYCTFSLGRFWLEKVHFSHCIQNWEEIESLKNEKKVLEKSWNSVIPFPFEP